MISMYSVLGGGGDFCSVKKKKSGATRNVLHSDSQKQLIKMKRLNNDFRAVIVYIDNR